MKICMYCGQSLPDEAVFCAGCGNRLDAVEPYEEAPVADKPKKKKILIAVIAAVSAVAVLFFTFSFIFNWFGLFSPMARVARATMRTVQADSMTIDVGIKTTSGDYYAERSAIARIVIDEEAEEVHRYSENSYYVNYGDQVSRSEGASATSNGREYTYSAVDGKVTSGRISEVDDKEFFDQREEIEEEIDWEEVIEEAGWEDILDEDEMDNFVRELNRKYFGNRRWLKKNAGYSKKGNTYTFRPDTETFIEALADIVDESDAFTRKGKREAEEGFDKLLDNLDKDGTDLDIEVSFTVKGRYLSNVHIEYAMAAEGDTEEVELDIDISDVNKTEIPKSDVRYVKDTVNEYLEVKGIKYDECDVCSDFGRLYAYGGKDLCWDCYDERKYG